MSKFDALNNQWNVPLEVSIEQLNLSVSELKDIQLSNEGLIQAITGIFSKGFNALRLGVNKLTETEQKQLSVDEEAVRKLTSKVFTNNYAYLIDRQVSVPAGMNTTYVTYTSHGLKMSETFKNTMGLVEQLRSDIGRIISTQDGIKDATIFSDALYVKALKELKKDLDTLSKIRKGNEFNAMRPYGDVFKNNGELIESINITRKANNNFNLIDRRKLMVSVETTMNYVKELSDLAKQDGFSKQLVAKVGNAVACVAEFIEAFSASIFNQEMTVRALNEVSWEISGLA